MINKKRLINKAFSIRTYSKSCVYDRYGLVEEGKYITFGSYEQDNNTSNGKENIEWLVLDVQGNNALLISAYGLDSVRYNEALTDTTWSQSTIRKWLNEDFKQSAFTEWEQSIILNTALSNTDMPIDQASTGGEDTVDSIFLLSYSEAMDYFVSDSSRKCSPSSYASAQGKVYISPAGTCWWWLRSPGRLQDRASYIRTDGSFDSAFVNDDLGAVRPALWINLAY